MEETLKNKFKIGLALGSGGAKGLAHVGAIKAFEEEGIEFDLIAGTSIGSIVGALYAKGYCADDMLSLLEEVGITDPQFMIMFAIGFIDLSDVINKFTGGAHFSDLKKPFKAVAVDVDRGKEVVLDEGELSTALASSSAIPPIRPIERDGRKLVDGAFLNCVPADVVKEMGADFVLSINLGKGFETNQGIKSALDETYPKNNIPLCNRSEKCYKFSDFILEPDLSSYGSASIKDLDEIYKIGYDLAKNKAKEIKKAIKNKRKG